MSIYPFFKGLFPQPSELSAAPQSLSPGFQPRYGNCRANQQARGDLHPAAPNTELAVQRALPRCCAC